MFQSQKYEYFLVFLMIVSLLPLIIFLISKLMAPTNQG